MNYVHLLFACAQAYSLFFNYQELLSAKHLDII